MFDLTVPLPAWQPVRGSSSNRNRFRLATMARACAATALVALPSSWAHAQVMWQVASGDWSVAENWAGGVPNTATSATISAGTATVNSLGAACQLLQLGPDGNGSLQIVGGSLATVREMIDGTITQTGGEHSVRDYSIFNESHLWVGMFGTGNYNQTGGRNEVYRLVLGGNYVNTQGFYNLSDTGDLSAEFETIGGLAGSGEFVQSGGTNTISGYMTINTANTGGETPSRAVYTLNSGTLTAGVGEYVGSFFFEGAGVFTQNGGTNTTGLLSIASFAGTSGTYNLNGGTLNLTSLRKGNGTATFNFGGGTLQALASFSTNVPMTLTGVNDDASMDTAEHDVTFTGQLSGSGGLNKLGTGSLILSAANTYTGDTAVLDGTLRLDSTGSLTLAIDEAGNSGITIAAGAEVDLFGAVRLHVGNLSDSAKTWTLINNSGTLKYEPSFALTMDDGTPFVQSNDIWVCSNGLQQWTFTEATGVLSLVTAPEPSSVVLLAISGVCLLVGARRRRFL